MESFKQTDNSWKVLTIVTKSSIVGVEAFTDPPMEWNQSLSCTLLWKNGQLCDKFLLMQLGKNLIHSPIQNHYL